MKDLLADIRTHCVNGSTDTLKAEDRQTIVDALKSLSEQLYVEGNADYAGKTVFTGYRTSSNLTFNNDEADTEYQITQKFQSSELEEKRYYSGVVNVPETLTDSVPECDVVVREKTYERLRLAYNGKTELKNVSYTLKDGTEQNLVETDQNGNTTYNGITVYESEEAWDAGTTAENWTAGEGADTTSASGGKVVGDDEIVYIKKTGEFIFGKNIANTISDGRASISAEYTKKDFSKGELRPEYYYDCIDISDDNPEQHITYTKQNQEINYTIANNTELTINTQASDVFDSGILRDVEDLINVAQKSIAANNKVVELENMMNEAQYQNEEAQAKLQTYLDAAIREADFADDDLQKTFEHYITAFDNYLENVNVAITNVGSMQNRLQMTKTRVENQQMTIEDLKTANEDRDISDIIIDYTAAYNAYQASLTAASKVGDVSLLKYL